MLLLNQPPTGHVKSHFNFWDGIESYKKIQISLLLTSLEDAGTSVQQETWTRTGVCLCRQLHGIFLQARSATWYLQSPLGTSPKPWGVLVTSRDSGFPIVLSHRSDVVAMYVAHKQYSARTIVG
jgi:hypothetical protein